jgi:hypothetical protein
LRHRRNESSYKAPDFWRKFNEGNNYDYVDIILIHRDNGDTKPYDTYFINKQDNISCREGKTPITTERDVKGNTFTFRCDRPATLATTLSLNTSAGNAVAINAVGTALSETELRQLQQYVANLKAITTEARNNISDKGVCTIFVYCDWLFCSS